MKVPKGIKRQGKNPGSMVSNAAKRSRRMKTVKSKKTIVRVVSVECRGQKPDQRTSRTGLKERNQTARLSCVIIEFVGKG